MTRAPSLEGTGVAERILHKTPDGRRGLEITMYDGRNPPFFAASANVPSAAAGARLTADGNG